MWLARRIGVLMGGLSSERELSLRTGDAVHAALIDRGHDAVKIFVDRDLDLALRAERVDVAFLALHGRYGEDGCVQGLLELLGIPYTGSSVLASALAMDKLKAKELFRLHNLPTPPYYVQHRGDGNAVAQHGSFGFPAVVKPRAEGSSLGVKRVDDLDDLEAAVDEAARFDDDVLVERYIDGLELHVAVLGGRAIGAIEGRPGERAVNLVSPPRIGPERLRGVFAFAERAVRALEAQGLCEVDIVVSERGNEYVLEVDTQPSLGPSGLVPKIAHAIDLDFGDLVDAVLCDAQLHSGGRSGQSRARGSLTPGTERRVEHH
jgi:D-alanine-D-alanine ligase